ncbi:MAG: FAD:protein FMN transferase [Gammaproteobacteria bacterium]|nr:FAD:protein FMN transferase [Gammaproteobacteria bacterium]MDH3750075.1 FAD:protein FMN transferase [Gammaproteobacteria bacterium]
MASPCEVLCEIDTADEARRLTELVAAEAWRIEDKFSRYLPANIINRINEANGKPVEVDPETSQLIDFSTTLHEISAGRFDITSGVLRRVWHFDGSDNIPTKTAVRKVMEQVGWGRVTWDSPLLHMPPGMEIDLGGIGKEYAVDRVATMLREATTASCLVNFGGDLVAVRKPCLRNAWKVGVEAVHASNTNAEKLLNLQVGALATSGDARRFLIRDGVRYSHILDPKTGWPVPDAPRSITVAADTCTQAGMFSTLAMLEGARAEAFLDVQEVRYWCYRGNDPGGRKIGVVT